MNHVHYKTAHWKASGFSFFFGRFVGLANISVIWEGVRVREKTGCCPWSCRREEVMEKGSEGSAQNL